MDRVVTPLDTSCEAEYEDGYTLSETALGDENPYGEGNTFTAIVNRLPEAEHGQMVRFTVFYQDQRHDIDWRGLPNDAKPVRLRYGYSTLHVGGGVESGWSGLDFGYETNAGREIVSL